MLEAGQLWLGNGNSVRIHEVEDGLAVWSDRDRHHARTPVVALEFRLESEFHLAPFKVHKDYRPRLMGIIS